MNTRPQDRKPPAKPAKARGGRGFRHASETARGAVDQIVGRSGFAEADVLLRWEEIAGDTLAKSCQPVKVHYGANRNLGATLIVQADSGRAPEVSHLAPRIVEVQPGWASSQAIATCGTVQPCASAISRIASIRS